MFCTVSVELPSGLTSSITTTRTGALFVPTDLFSFTSLTETTTVNGKSYTSTFDKATRTYMHTSPMGRVATTVINDQYFPCVSIPTLIRMKEAAGRPRDLDDIQYLRWILNEGKQDESDR